MAKKQKLELTWVGKDELPKLEPRILIEDPDKSYHAKVRHGEDDIFDNILIKGDNLLALKALEQDYSGKVKCIYIDPPYNIDAATPFYEDGLEHSKWLSLMRRRLEYLKELLAKDGVIFVQIDDMEMPYLTVVMDEVFGRRNRVNIVSVKMSEATGVKMSHASRRFPKTKEFILFYKKDEAPEITPIAIPLESWNEEYKEILLGITESQIAQIKELLYQDRGEASQVEELNQMVASASIMSLNAYFKKQGISKKGDQQEFKWANAYRIIQAVGAGSLRSRALDSRKDGQDLSAVISARNKLSLFKTQFNEESKDPRIRLLFADKYLTFNPGDFWPDIKTAGGVGMEGGVEFPNGKKPEALINRIIAATTKPGDLILDSFGGSGTTAAVAHKMNRKWVMVEIGDHADTHIAPRIQRIIDGEDPGGITKSVDWKGGGGFRYYTLAPSLLATDKFGNWVISKDYNPAMLSEAMCKHMGFKYAPSQDADEYWRHGHSTEADFIYVTTQNLTHDACKKLSDEVGEGRSLLICCKAYSANAEAFDNLTLVKIPTAILAKCEWGQDDYSLNVANLPMADALEEGQDSIDDLPLFAEGDEDA